MSTPAATAPASETVRDDAQTSPAGEESVARPAIEVEMLIEEISIDGMCGVY